MENIKKYYKSTLATVAALAGMVGLWAENLLNLIDRVKGMF